MPCEAPVMTATFLSLLMLVSFMLPGHGCAGALESSWTFPFERSSWRRRLSVIRRSYERPPIAPATRSSVTLSSAESSPSHRIYRELARSSLMLTTAAWAQASSLSPPGEPETPSAPTTSSLTLIATPPASGAMLGSVASAAPLGFLARSAAKALDASNRKIGPKVTTVYALRKADVVVWMVEWSPLASSLMTPEVSTTAAETG